MTDTTPPDEPFRVEDYLARGDATGWFDVVYARAHGDANAVPWARAEPRPAVVRWLRKNEIDGMGQRAAVVACGLGDDAEALSARGFDVTAFDISATAIDWCQQRFPDSAVKYLVADLFDPPADWVGGFDFVLEVFTVQALPIELRAESIAAVARLIRPGGRLLVVCIGTHDAEARRGPPWPLTREEVDLFQRHGLSEVQFDILPHPNGLPSNRWRIEYHRAG